MASRELFKITSVVAAGSVLASACNPIETAKQVIEDIKDIKKDAATKVIEGMIDKGITQLDVIRLAELRASGELKDDEFTVASELLRVSTENCKTKYVSPSQDDKTPEEERISIKNVSLMATKDSNDTAGFLGFM